MISDWSGIAYEYAYTTKKPVLFINTPMKIMNPEYEKIEPNAINIWSREILGETVEPDNLKDVDKLVERMLKDSKKYSKKIEGLIDDSIYNLGNSSEVGANYIIEEIQRIVKNKKGDK